MFIPAESAPLIPILPNSRVGLLVCTLSHGELVGKTIARWWAGWKACSKEEEGAGPSHGHTYYSIFWQRTVLLSSGAICSRSPL